MAIYDIAHDSVVIPRIGSEICKSDIWYQVIRTETYQDEASHFTTIATLRELLEDGGFADKDTIRVNLDTWDYTY